MPDSPARQRIACLPVNAGSNPYQSLVMRGLEADGRFTARYGARGKRFAALRTWLRWRPDYILYDWNTYYFVRRSRLMTRVYGALFLLDLRITRWLGTRIVWTIHQLEAHDAPFPDVQQRIQRRFAGLCEWVRVMWPSTAARASAYLGLPLDRIRVQPEGSFVGHYPDDRTRADARARLQLPQDAVVLLYFGAVKAYKGVEELIQAFRALPGDGLRLVVAGNCSNQELRQRILALAAPDPRIQLHLAFIAESDVQTYFRAADVAVLPFRKIENSGSAILALGFGTPVIAPAIGVLVERLAAQRGLLYDDGGLPAALERAIAMGPEALARLGAEGRQSLAAHRWEDFARWFT